ncbi:MAG: amino acid decarboxylase, partial [Clostridiaceae bacterium]|nr:amino acid decarboxylase [Clostridiaceae bacterium]
YAEQGYLVFMISAETKSSELRTLAAALGRNTCGPAAQVPLPPVRLSRAMTVREAVFAPQERIPAPLCPGRVSASPAVSCPPAIPIAVPGEILNADAAALFARCGIREILAVKE